MKKMEAELARRNSFQGKHYRDLVSGATKA